MAERKSKKYRARGWILSVVIAVIVWLLVTYATDTDITKSVKITGITYSGENALAQNGLVIKKESAVADTRVKLSGKRNDFIRYIDDVTVDVDVSEITEAGEHKLEGRVNAGNLDTVISSYVSVTVEIENYVEKEVPVYTVQAGENKDYMVKSEAESEKFKLSGGESEVNSISYAYLVVDISKINKDCDTVSRVEFADEDDETLTEFYTIPVRDKGMTVHNLVYEKKELSVMPELSPQLAAAYTIDYDKTEISPEKVTIGLRGRTSDTVKAVITENTSDERTYKLTAEDGMYIPDDVSEVKIKAALKQKEQ